MDARGLHDPQARRPPRRRVRSFPCRGLEPGRHARDLAHRGSPALRRPSFAVRFRALGALAPARRSEAVHPTVQCPQRRPSIRNADDHLPRLVSFSTSPRSRTSCRILMMTPHSTLTQTETPRLMTNGPRSLANRLTPHHPQCDFADGRASFDAVAASLTKTQIKAASHPGSILVLAGAGTGKTSTLTAAVAHRIAVDKIPPLRVLAVTFTNKAAGEMARRIRATLGPDAAPHWLGTFHGLAARQLRTGPDVASLRDNFDILGAGDSRRILRRIMKAMNLSSDEAEGGKRDPAKIVAGHIGKFKDLLMTPKGARSHVENGIAEANRTGAPIDAAGLTMAAKVYPEYQTRLREANAADFGDLLLWPTLALVNDADYRAR